MKIRLTEHCPGGGTLTRAIVDGLSGLAEVEVAAGAEINPAYVKLFSEAHPEASTFCGSLSRFSPAELSTAGDGINLYVVGIPCTGASKAGRAKNGLAHAEEHAGVGHLFLPVMHYVRLHRPELIVFENTDAYSSTFSAGVIRRTLEQAGYSFFEKIVDPHAEFETATRRMRWVLVASRIGRFSWLYEAKPYSGTMDDVLDAPSALDEEEAATETQVNADTAYVTRKQSEGCGFARRILSRSDRKCPTIPRSYGKRQPTGTFVETRNGSYRMLRPTEVARIHGFPDGSLHLPNSKTLAYEVLGQGVCYRPFYSLARSLGEWLRDGRREMAFEGASAQPAQLELFAS